MVTRPWLVSPGSILAVINSACASPTKIDPPASSCCVPPFLVLGTRPLCARRGRQRGERLGQARQLALLHAVTAPSNREHFSVMQQAVKQRRAPHLIAQPPAPLAEAPPTRHEPHPPHVP